ncbi:leucine-rich repeat-containing [Chlorella sorokiniana]|uniref:Leucine-rich repeat-containing n=1 Tax=Chlorella sorokiniana TaxID=3076 RepID=A0A2P6TEU6_CHLSO|nr:leucine-rich repeat-containing [Chlorella sorokiniana]|eukprot:PRW32494.1 leucine-rich repeat-containing [Chlorella sorokiniana]
MAPGGPGALQIGQLPEPVLEAIFAKCDLQTRSNCRPLLEAIFAKCDLQTRAGVLPLVCRAFHGLLAGPNAVVWPSLEFHADISTQGGLQHARSFLAWLAAHGSLLRTLHLDLWNNGHTPQADDGVAQLGSQLESSLATLCSCEFLRMRWGGLQLRVGEWVQQAAGLTCMALSAHEMTVSTAMASLTSLGHLELSTVSDMGPMLLPGSLPPSITRLCIVPAPVRFPPALPPDMNGIMPAELPDQLLALPLVYLDVSESLFQGPHLSACLPRLTRLTSLAFDKCELTDGIPSQLSLLTNLRILSFDGCMRHHHQEDSWTALSTLTRLVSLSLSNSELYQVPAAVLNLPLLRHVYLEHNELRDLPGGQWWSRLHVLSLDWEPLLRSGHALLASAPHLRRLALGSHLIHTHAGDAVPPLASADAVLQALKEHPALREVLLVARSGMMSAGPTVVVLEVLLRMASLRPTLSVRPIEHDTFFVEEPPPDDSEAALEQAAS